MDLAFPLDLGSDQKQGPRLSGMLVLVLSREGHVSLPGGSLNASTMIPARVTDPAGGGDFQWPWQPNRLSKAVTEQHTGPAFPHLSGQWIALGLRSSLGRALGRELRLLGTGALRVREAQDTESSRQLHPLGS